MRVSQDGGLLGEVLLEDIDWSGMLFSIIIINYRRPLVDSDLIEDVLLSAFTLLTLLYLGLSLLSRFRRVHVLLFFLFELPILHGIPSQGRLDYLVAPHAFLLKYHGHS